jgi:hypothetical protein
MITVQGVQVPRAAMADLALELRETGNHLLADKIRDALGRNAAEIELDPSERDRLAIALTEPSLDLAHLRDALMRNR